MATTNLYLIPWKLMLVYLNMPPLWRSLSICVYFIMCSILTISKKHVRLKNLQKPFFAKYWFTIINISLKWFVAIMLQKWNFHLMVVYSSDGIVRTALLNTLQHKLYFMLLEKQFIHETDILYHSIFRILKRRYRHVSLMCQNNDRKKKYWQNSAKNGNSFIWWMPVEQRISIWRLQVDFHSIGHSIAYFS